jgi:hypothetical protein
VFLKSASLNSHENEINKLLHSNGHLSIVAHVGSSHTIFRSTEVLLLLLFTLRKDLFV